MEAKIKDIEEKFKITLPKDRNFFKKIYKLYLGKTILPKIDLNDYDFEGVNVKYYNFHKDCRMKYN